MRHAEISADHKHLRNFHGGNDGNLNFQQWIKDCYFTYQDQHNTKCSKVV